MEGYSIRIPEVFIVSLCEKCGRDHAPHQGMSGISCF